MSLNRKLAKARNKRDSKAMAFDAIVDRGIEIARSRGLDVHVGEITDKGFEILAENADDAAKAREIVGQHILDTMSGKYSGIRLVKTGEEKWKVKEECC